MISASTRRVLATFLYEEPSDVLLVQEVLEKWSTPLTYEGPSWEGIERFHFMVAKHYHKGALETAGWYKYPSSTSKGQDGKNWRLVLTETPSNVSIDCNSLLFDGVWTLSTVVHANPNIDVKELEVIDDDDPWTLSMKWNIKLVELLATDGYDFDGVKKEMQERLEARDRLAEKVLKEAPENWIIAFNRWGLGPDEGATLEPLPGGRYMVFLNPGLMESEAHITEAIWSLSDALKNKTQGVNNG